MFLHGYLTFPSNGVPWVRELEIGQWIMIFLLATLFLIPDISYIVLCNKSSPKLMVVGSLQFLLGYSRHNFIQVVGRSVTHLSL